jgi:hypothetical protein
MANIQITHDASIENARSESSVVINPNNPLQAVSASKKFNNIQTYDFTLATEYSTDGGQTWHDSAALAMPGFTVMTDPTLAWDDSGNVFLVGLAGTNPPAWNTIGIVIYKSTDGGMTWSVPNPIHYSTGDDKQWAAGDGNPASPHHGNVYAVWDDLNAGGMAFARTLDHGTTWTGAGGNPAGSLIQTGTVFPEIYVAPNGYVYAVSIGGPQITMIVSTDGGNTFNPATDPANGVTTLEASLPPVDGWPEFPGGSFRVITDPTVAVYGSTVLVAWADYRSTISSRIYYARSVDGGATWTTGPSGQPLLTGPIPGNFQHFHPQMTADPNGVFGCVLYEFGPKPAAMLIDVILARSYDGGASFSPLTVTDQPWDPSVDAPWAHGDPNVTFIGDYFGLSASAQAFLPVWTDTRTGVQELWTDIVPAISTELIVGNTALIEGGFRADDDRPGNFEALLVEGNDLLHYWRDNSDPALPWYKGVVVSAQATGPACLIEGSFRADDDRPGNFEALVLEGNDLVHYWRDNSDPALPWYRGVVVSAQATGPACLIEGSFRADDDRPGNFEALVLEGRNLLHYWRDNSDPALPWYQTVVVSAQATGPATLIEGSFRADDDRPGNFEALLNETTTVGQITMNSVVHHWRDNSDPALPWYLGVTLPG